MPDSSRNRSSQKGNEKKKRTGRNPKEKTIYEKLPDDSVYAPEESMDTADDISGEIYSQSPQMDEDIDYDDIGRRRKLNVYLFLGLGLVFFISMQITRRAIS